MHRYIFHPLKAKHSMSNWNKKCLKYVLKPVLHFQGFNFLCCELANAFKCLIFNKHRSITKLHHKINYIMP